MRISALNAREILDSRGLPTLEVTMQAGSLIERFSVPGGKSTGRHEAKILAGPDNSMRPAIAAINTLKTKLIGQPLSFQSDFDQLLTGQDNTSDKHELGANTMLALSGAYLRLSALGQQQPLWQYIADWAKSEPQSPRLYANLVNGGKHAPGLDIQEFMVVPKAKGLKAIQQIRSIYRQLGDELVDKYGATSRLVGDEGGFAPNQASHDDIWEILAESAHQYDSDLAADAAATSFQSGDGYKFAGHQVTSQELGELYLHWDKTYHLLSLEDPFAEDDLAAFSWLAGQAHHFMTVGDDLTTTSAKAIETSAKLIGAVIIKPNQIGNFSESLAAVNAANARGIKVIVSHRSGETLDTTIADLAVGLGAFGLKLGAPARGERIAKYNRLLEIEEEMNA